MNSRLRHLITSALSWVALADKMPEHERISEEEVASTLVGFRRVLKESGLNRLHPSLLGNKMHPFSVKTSQWLRGRKKIDPE